MTGYYRDEAPSPQFQAGRAATEQAAGMRLTKFFAPARCYDPLSPPIYALVMSESRLLNLPELLLTRVQRCEKYRLPCGRWCVVVEAALWESVTRLLG